MFTAVQVPFFSRRSMSGSFTKATCTQNLAPSAPFRLSRTRAVVPRWSGTYLRRDTGDAVPRRCLHQFHRHAFASARSQARGAETYTPARRFRRPHRPTHARDGPRAPQLGLLADRNRRPAEQSCTTATLPCVRCTNISCRPQILPYCRPMGAD